MAGILEYLGLGGGSVHAGLMFGVLDVLWIGLAVYTASRILSRLWLRLRGRADS